MTRRTILLLALALVLAASTGSLTLVPPAAARGNPAAIVQTCAVGTDCTPDAFAVCTPSAPPIDCSSAKQVVIKLSAWPPNKLVHLWWLATTPDNQTKTDCSQTENLWDKRTFVGDVTTNDSGVFYLTTTLPPLGTRNTLDPQTSTWSYGTNWVCATTASGRGQIGDIGDQPFFIA